MTDIIIKWISDRSEIDAEIDAAKEEVDEVKDELIEEKDLITQDLFGLLADVEQKAQIQSIRTEEENQRLGAVRAKLEFLKNESDALGRITLLNIAEKNALNREMRITFNEIQALEARSKVIKEEVKQGESKLAAISIGVSSVLGFLSLASALTGDIADVAFSTALSVASSTISLAIVYGTLGAASGNLALVAAGGAAASSAASIINTLKIYQSRNQTILNQRNTQQLHRSNY